MSRLYSDSDSPYLNPRFIEKLFVYTSDSVDFSRRDMSFDAQLATGAGVGVKTFLASNFSSVKTEKVAEFTADATRGEFRNLSHEDLALKVAQFRNSRIESDARIFGINMESSIYHCLVRVKNGCLIHEEPYSEIDLSKLRVVSKGNEPGHTRFEDGSSKYVFNISKNTLFKSFDLSKHANSDIITIEVIDDIFERLLAGWLGEFSPVDVEFVKEIERTELADEQFVILPLYSSRTGQVEAKSGINQWNADGRAREFGEAYIPHPKEVRKAHEGFFPPQDVPFVLRMPDGSEMTAKVCQQDGKAIMSNPNKVLCDWLFRLIDESPAVSQSRMQNRNPYTLADLHRVGRDSVKIRLIDREKRIYEMEPMSLGSYERFINPELAALELSE